MAATSKPVRKHAKHVHKEMQKKYPGFGFEKDVKSAKSIAKAHADKGLVTRKGKLNQQKVESGLAESRKMMRKKHG